MLEFTCPSCGKRVQGDDSLAGQSVLCPVCNKAIAAPATVEAASQAKGGWSAASVDVAFREGEPLPPIRKEIPRIVMRWIPVLIVAVIIMLSVLLLLPGVPRVRDTGARYQSTNNLKEIALAFHSFHDANKRLPYNGNVPAVANDFKTGSWAFQILPYIDQGRLFADPRDRTSGISAYMCPGRGRPSVCTTGAWTDYFINPWMNDPVNGAVNALDGGRVLIDITDGTSNTILVGQGIIDPDLYNATAAIVQSSDIFKGGLASTARRSTINQRDRKRVVELNWGGPYRRGALMAMGDATVRMFPYFTHSGGVITAGVSTTTTPGLGIFLTPRGNEPCELPDT